ncbi:MAG: hypothetical protein P8Q95_07650 [Candidatus Poseidoniaceae archaeon]|nr:hypothetical protein [Candidatus Poseidoniaceae archaeon]
METATMAGLLDKAKATNDGEEKVEKSDNVKSGLLSKGASKVVTTTTVTTTEASIVGDSNDTARILGMVGWAVILVGAIISLQGGGFGLIVVLVVLAIGLGSIVQSQRMIGNISQPKMVASIVVAILIASGPYIALALVPVSSNVAISEVSFDESTNKLSFTVRGSFEEAEVELSYADEVLWSDVGKMSNDKHTFSLTIDSDVFRGNAMDHRGPENGQIKDYILSVESSSGQENSVTINADYMTREVKDAAVKIVQISKPIDNEVKVVGLQMQLNLGLIDSSLQNKDGGGHSVVHAWPVSSDYTVDTRIYKSSSKTLWDHDGIIDVSGYDATWSCSTSSTGSKAGVTQQTWLGLCGTYDDPEMAIEYIARDDFYDDDGCYTFEVTITNELYEESQTTVINSDSWELEWDAQESDTPLDVC